MLCLFNNNNFNYSFLLVHFLQQFQHLSSYLDSWHKSEISNEDNTQLSGHILHDRPALITKAWKKQNNNQGKVKKCTIFNKPWLNYILQTYLELCAVWPRGRQGWKPQTWWAPRRSPARLPPPDKGRSHCREKNKIPSTLSTVIFGNIHFHHITTVWNSV